MKRIEEVTVKVDSDLPTKTIDRLKHTAFMRMIQSHVPMYNHISNNAKDGEDPYEALKLARQYVENHRHESMYMMQIAQQVMKQAGRYSLLCSRLLSTSAATELRNSAIAASSSGERRWTGRAL